MYTRPSSVAPATAWPMPELSEPSPGCSLVMDRS
jgi:hypothetical protein